MLKTGREDLTKFDLSIWFEENGYSVYWEKKNKFGYKTFKISGTQNKPDLLVHKDKIYAIIEVKAGKSRNTRKGKKILAYYKDYSDGVSKYFIEKKEVKPSFFMIANEHSINGKLFEENEKKYQDKEITIKYKMCPKFEYMVTFDFIRSLWNIWQNTADRKDLRNKDLGLGIVLSNVLNEMKTPYKPMFFVMSFNNDKNRWIQKFRSEFYEL